MWLSYSRYRAVVLNLVGSGDEIDYHSSVCLSSYRSKVLNQSARVFALGYLHAYTYLLLKHDMV